MVPPYLIAEQLVLRHEFLSLRGQPRASSARSPDPPVEKGETESVLTPLQGLERADKGYIQLCRCSIERARLLHRFQQMETVAIPRSGSPIVSSAIFFFPYLRLPPLKGWAPPCVSVPRLPHGKISIAPEGRTIHQSLQQRTLAPLSFRAQPLKSPPYTVCVCFLRNVQRQKGHARNGNGQAKKRPRRIGKK